MENSELNEVKKIADLKPKMPLKGIIKKIELFGAFVDVGVETLGLIHISKIKRDPLQRIQDVLEEGQEIDVWVERVDANAGRLELTLNQPIQLEWKDIKPGMKIVGNVVRLEKFGAFIEIGAVRPGLVHVSEMSSGYVSDPSDLVKVGDQVEVSVIDFDRKKRQIRLTMNIEEPVEEYLDEEETEEEPPTAMEVALRRALEDQTEEEPASSTPSSTQEPKQKDRDELEDILSRTLKQRVQSSSDG
jgi:transcriptional accessory protein Tex/SPT6